MQGARMRSHEGCRPCREELKDSISSRQKRCFNRVLLVVSILYVTIKQSRTN